MVCISCEICMALTPSHGAHQEEKNEKKFFFSLLEPISDDQSPISPVRSPIDAFSDFAKPEESPGLRKTKIWKFLFERLRGMRGSRKVKHMITLMHVTRYHSFQLE